MKHSIRIKQYICKEEDFGGWKQQREEIADHYLMKNGFQTEHLLYFSTTQKFQPFWRQYLLMKNQVKLVCRHWYGSNGRALTIITW